MRAGAAALAVAALLTGCTGDDPSGRPSAGVPTFTQPTVPAVAALGLDDCPEVDLDAAPTGDLPDLVLACSGQGPAVNVAGLADGTPTLLNFWASWCAPCARELPLLQRGSEAAGDRVRFLGVQTSETSDSWPALLAETGVTYPSVADPLKKLLPRLQGGAGLPVTMVVRGDGTVAGRVRGEIDDWAQLRRLVLDGAGVDLGPSPGPGS